MDYKLDKILSEISSIKVTLAGQAVELKEHIRRTALLEDQMKPLNAQMLRAEGALKIIGVLALLATIATGVVDMAKFIIGHLGS